jgi:late competence protein required for DNA uptake (superfamily II DNA/RNA helicase)
MDITVRQKKLLRRAVPLRVKHVYDVFMNYAFPVFLFLNEAVNMEHTLRTLSAQLTSVTNVNYS